MSARDVPPELQQQIQRETDGWPGLSPEQEAALGVIFATGRAMQASGPTAA